MSTKSQGWCLMFVSGRFKGGELPLQEGHQVLLGRDDDNEIHLREEGVSRVHAKFCVKGGVLDVRDMASTNGTIVNGARVTRQELHEGDQLLFGRSILVVHKDPGWTVEPKNSSRGAMRS